MPAPDAKVRDAVAFQGAQTIWWSSRPNKTTTGTPNAAAM
jgi:hypothetical protein